MSRAEFNADKDCPRCKGLGVIQHVRCKCTWKWREKPMVIGEIMTSDTNKTVVSLTEWQGKNHLDIRDWFKTANMSDWAPTKRGIKLNPKYVSELVTLCEAAEDTIRRNDAGTNG